MAQPGGGPGPNVRWICPLGSVRTAMWRSSQWQHMVRWAALRNARYSREAERPGGAAATDAQVARILTASGDLGAADACTRRALGRAIPLAGRGEGWSAPQLPPAHLTKSPRSLLVPVGGFMSRARRSSRPQPGHDRNALSRPRRHRRRNYPAAGACESTSAAHAVAGLYPTNSGKPASPRPCTGLPPAVCAALPRDSHRSPRPHGGC